jgi:hypothetical protein
MTARARNRPGIVLFDVILGTTLIVIAGIAFVTMLGQNFETVDLVRHREREITRASGEVERMSALWSAHDFEAHRGTFRLGAFDATVAVAAPNLYSVAIADTVHEVILLKTMFYVSDTTHAGH